MPWDVDRALYEFGFPMGPFAMDDLAGLDIGWSKETSRGATILEVLCEMDRRGQKTGAGYYDYDADRKATPSAITENVIADFAARSGRPKRAYSDAEILERCLLPMINEGVKILEEGMAIRASDIDVIWNNGYGWPRHRGGPMWYADELGVTTVLERLTALEASEGERFRPAKLLRDLAARGRPLHELTPSIR